MINVRTHKNLQYVFPASKMKIPNAVSMTLCLHETLDKDIPYDECLLLQVDSVEMLGPQIC